MKYQIKFIISFISLIVLNIIAYKLTIKILTYQPWMIVGGFIFLIGVVINILILYYSFKLKNNSILGVILYWILALLNNFSGFNIVPKLLADTLAPLYISLYSSLWSLVFPYNLPGKISLSIFNFFTPYQIIRLIVCILFLVTSISIMVRQFAFKQSKKN